MDTDANEGCVYPLGDNDSRKVVSGTPFVKGWGTGGVIWKMVSRARYH